MLETEKNELEYFQTYCLLARCVRKWRLVLKYLESLGIQRIVVVWDVVVVHDGMFWNVVKVVECVLVRRILVEWMASDEI